MKIHLTSFFFFILIFNSHSSAQEGRAKHDKLKAFIKCEVNSSQNQNQDSRCSPPEKIARIPSQDDKIAPDNLNFQELKADKAPIHDYGHPRFFHSQWEAPNFRGGGSSR